MNWLTVICDKPHLELLKKTLGLSLRGGGGGDVIAPLNIIRLVLLTESQ